MAGIVQQNFTPYDDAIRVTGYSRRYLGHRDTGFRGGKHPMWTVVFIFDQDAVEARSLQLLQIRQRVRTDCFEAG